ncbi:MAG: 2-oxoacid:acceptor oxidoreductase family protein [Deltaproteobacteria bacterium]|nr:2-oxoacid:acceptor oxidoreductase family protein [Deltaproteobacteria bacterium]MBN2671676.1 2-oxoacid:acceptor oxidoreductase family protein [Deltaproteobacteria bacterium]
MKTTDVLFAGFGGHGMLMAGKLLAMAMIKQGRQVSWLPAYGAEMRGGTANVTVCISDGDVMSPYIERPNSLVVMNTPSLHKFGPKVKTGGLVLVNSTLVRESFERDDCHVLYLPAGDIAMGLGNVKATNLVLLGAFIGLSKIVTKEDMIEVIQESFTSKSKFIPLNVSAFAAGYEEGTKLRLENDVELELEDEERDSTYAYSNG